MESNGNPFLKKFPRYNFGENSWVSVGEQEAGAFDVIIELTRDEFMDKLVECLSRYLNIKHLSEKYMLSFIFGISKKYNIKTEAVFLNLSDAKKFIKSSLGKEISKSSYQRAIRRFIASGIIYPSKRNSWFYFNPDIFEVNQSFSVSQTYSIKKKSKKCEDTMDFFSQDQCVLSSR